jgi:hypothetical protein
MNNAITSHDFAAERGRGRLLVPNLFPSGKAHESRKHATTLVARVLLGVAVATTGLLSGSFHEAEAQVVEEAPTNPADAYGVRYAARKLVMPKGMIRGTFDVVIGKVPGGEAPVGGVPDQETTTLNFGAAVSPVKHLEVGFSRYRMGSYPNPDTLRAFGGDGLIPIIAQGRDLIPALASNSPVFGDMFAYARVEAPNTSTVDVGFDLGFLIPTASEFGVLIGVPIRFHGGDVFAFDAGLMVNVDNISGDGQNITSISLPWNVVLSVTDEVFLKVNSGFNSLDVSSSVPLNVFPFGLGAGVTVPGERIMSDVFAAFSWPVLGTVVSDFGFGRVSEATTDLWTITIGVNFYSPVLF